jgi:quercetin dioxygenase-like cupin family protein
MNRKVGIAAVCAAGLISSLCMMNAQQVVKIDPNNPNFTGGKMSNVDENSVGNIGHYHFDKGARTKWHMHEGGQVILVESGVGLYQVKGGPVVELHANETTYAPPGVWHWHGASPKEGGTQYNLSRGNITWGDTVTDKEYTAKPKRP